jgi:type I restriction enzyme S subunit
MKLETFFEKFALFADAPGAVGKMRELVLELAVRGKLVAQDNRDEPASSLLESTASERAKLIAARKIKSRPTSPVEAIEQPFDVPSSWEWARLSDVGYELGQKVPDKRFTYIDVGGIDSEKGQISDRVEKLEPADAPSRARKLVARGTVIYSTVRPYLLNIAIVDQDFDPEAIASTAFGILHPFEGVNNRYLFYWLRSAPFTAYVQAGMKGMAYPAINDEKFYSGYIALPPLAEQMRIVAKVDELMALCDRLEAQQLEREAQAGQLARASLARFADAPTPANLNLLFHSSFPISPSDLRKSILTLAVQGKLVPQDPNDEPAEELLRRVDASPKRAMRTKASEEDEGGETTEFEPLFRLPSGWEWAPFRRLPLQASVGIDRGRSMQGREKAVGYFKMNNIRNSGGVDLSDITRIDATPVEIEAFALADGDFLFNTRNSRELVGKTCVFRAPSVEPILYNNNILRVRFIEGFSPDFLDYWFRSPEGSAELEKLKSNTTNVCAIYQGKLFGFPCVVPPLAEQRRIVAKVSELMALVDELETQLAASRAAAEKLLTALVAELTGTTSRLPTDL